MNEADTKSCPVCGSDSLDTILSMPAMPVFCNVLWDSREEATACARGDIVLEHCRNCSFVFNSAFDPTLVRYTQRYDNCLHFSGRFRQYAESLAERLIARYDLHGKLVVDVGCGKGDFLRLLCERGPNRGIGYDPSFEAREDIAGLGEGIRIVNDTYSGAYAGHGGDFLCCRHVLEHMENPADLLEEILRGLGGRDGIPVFFEVPNGAYTIEHVFVWDVIYEHPGYFTARSLRRLFGESGFSVTEVDVEFEGQYLGLHAVTGGTTPSRDGGASDSREAPVEIAVEEFAAAYADLLSRWRGELEALAAQGQKAVVWGAGSKGVTFLNLLDREGQIEYAVDVSPNKRGRYVAGSGQRIEEPAFLRSYRPDTVLVMNPVYEREISSQLTALGVDAKVKTL